MVRALAAALLVVSSSVGLAPDRGDYEGGENFAVPRPYVLAAVRTVTVTTNGAWSDAVSGEETPEDCGEFLLAPRDVRDYFKHARRVSYKEYSHDLDMSRCYAGGRIVFANGGQGNWRIDRVRRGLISLNDGRNLYFHCPKCRGKAFD